MKKVLYLFTVLLFCSNTFSQKQAIEKLTYEDANNIDYFIKVKNNTRVLEYITQDGNSLKVGDTLVLGRPTSESAISTTYGSAYSDYVRVIDQLKIANAKKISIANSN